MAQTAKALWSLFIVLVLAGLYFLVWHTDPLPGNHEAVGLGENHIAHAAIGVVVLILAGLVLWRARRPRAAS